MCVVCVVSLRCCKLVSSAGCPLQVLQPTGTWDLFSDMLTQSSADMDDFTFRPRVTAVSMWSITVEWDAPPSAQRVALEYLVTVREDVDSLTSPVSSSSSSPVRRPPASGKGTQAQFALDVPVEEDGEDQESVPSSFGGALEMLEARNYTESFVVKGPEHGSVCKFELTEFKGEGLNPGDSFLFEVAVRSCDRSERGDARSLSSACLLHCSLLRTVCEHAVLWMDGVAGSGGLHGGAGAMWLNGSEASWTDDDDEHTWFGSCEPVKGTTTPCSAAQRAVVLGGRHPRIFLVEPVTFDSNKVGAPVVCQSLPAVPVIVVLVPGHFACGGRRRPERAC